MSEAIKNRYDFIVLFDVENGNPNGDPDAGNMPRVDAETNYGIITDVCLKRKIRNYIEAACDDKDGYRIYVKSNIPLERTNKEAYKYLGLEKIEAKKLKKSDPDIDLKIKNFMCRNFFDIRTFGAVMTTFTNDKLNCGQVCGPVQFSFARSIEPVLPQDITISRVTVATETEAETKNTMFGHKFIIPYALYKVEGYVSANLARKVTGFSEEDLQLLWKAIINMFECDRAAARGNMAVRELIVFKHDSELGEAPAYKLFDTVKISRNNQEKPARAYSDYTVTVDESKIPAGVTMQRMI